MGLTGYQIGKTKVFLRAGQMAELDARRTEVLGDAAKIIQRQIRTYIARKEFISLRKASVQLQSCWRGLSACKLYAQLRREAAALRIQKNFRSHVSRTSYVAVQKAAVSLQAGLRVMKACGEFIYRRQSKAAIAIQAYYRYHRAYSYYKSLQKAAIVTQCGWSQRVARKELQSLKMKSVWRNLHGDCSWKNVQGLRWKRQKHKKSQNWRKLYVHCKYKWKKQSLKQFKSSRQREKLLKKLFVIKETPVIVQDTEKIDALTAEVESLKVLLLSERQSAEEIRKAGTNAEVQNAELVQKLEDADRKVDQLQTSVQRLEEKLSNFESENQPRTTIIQRNQQNGTVPNGETKLSLNPHEMTPAKSNSREPELEETPQKSLNEKQHCISQDIGFSGGKLISACVLLIYKCLLHWRSFEVERTSVFDCIIQTIASSVEPVEVPDNNDVLAYWLCNTSMLLTLLQHTLKASGAASLTPQRRRSSSASLFGRMSQGLQGSPQRAGLPFLNGRVLGRLDDLRQVEAKYPALLFKQLTAFLEKIYGMIRDNLKKEISPLLGFCKQAPRTSRGNLVKGRASANAVAQQALIAHWKSIVKSLNNYLQTMKANYVCSSHIKIFCSTCSCYSTVSFCDRCCSFSKGEYVKTGLAELEQWCCYANEDYAGTAWDGLKHIRQAVGTHSVSSDVISNMRVLMTEDSNNAVSSLFLLDDDSSIPFSVDDISKSMQQVDLADIEPPPLIRENSGFVFLHQVIKSHSLRMMIKTFYTLNLFRDPAVGNLHISLDSSSRRTKTFGMKQERNTRHHLQLLNMVGCKACSKKMMNNSTCQMLENGSNAKPTEDMTFVDNSDCKRFPEEQNSTIPLQSSNFQISSGYKRSSSIMKLAVCASLPMDNLLMIESGYIIFDAMTCSVDVSDSETKVDEAVDEGNVVEKDGVEVKVEGASSEVSNEKSELKVDENVSVKGVNVSIVPARTLSREDEYLECDEIDDVEGNDEKKVLMVRVQVRLIQRRD
ncbi:hypothetical protein POM88_022294 [Heracleum sosnowskyi]|uniref:Uncharacterized protein n=1 Tax=Heracleum sosnowskyi TaxID=360622 RepID=A0AAD8MTJ0_9APIA|nr:hypothetical protein POM88_022294 [Heracleum sosnowskyi]